jgi:hypothetical protein
MLGGSPLLIGGRDERPACLDRDRQPSLAQLTEHCSGRQPGDPVSLHHLSLAGQLVAGLELACGDRASDLVRHLLVERARIMLVNGHDLMMPDWLNVKAVFVN